MKIKSPKTDYFEFQTKIVQTFFSKIKIIKKNATPPSTYCNNELSLYHNIVKISDLSPESGEMVRSYLVPLASMSMGRNGKSLSMTNWIEP